MRILVFALCLWSGQAAEDTSSCGTPDIPNGKPVDPLQNSYSNGRILAFRCDPGYELEGSQYGECINGRWKLPACKLKANSCGPPAHVSNSIPQPYRNVYAEGERFEYVCQPGYQLPKSTYSWCFGGKWRSTPTCDQIKQIDPTPTPTERSVAPDAPPCPAPHVPHARQLGPVEAAYPNGTLIAFQCNTGYEFEGHQYAVCLDGRWKLPVCKYPPSTCQAAPSVPNARPMDESSSVHPDGSIVRFQCLQDYEFERLRYAVCSNGQWILPVCKQTLSCSAPHVLHARQLDPVERAYPNRRVVVFDCHPGYQFEGDHFAVCLDRQWKLPVCKPQKDSFPESDDQNPTEKPVRPDPPSPCRAPPSVPNAWLADEPGSDHPHRSVARYQCIPGHTPGGSTYAVCSNGQWILPVCKRSPLPCHAPPPVMNARVLVHNPGPVHSEGSIVTYQCQPGYKFEGMNYAICSNGQWILPLCIYSPWPCRAPPPVRNAWLADELSPVYPDGSTVTYRCQPGYTLEGPTYALCSNGQWMLPVCTLLRCLTLPYIVNAQITSVHFGMELWVSCAPDHKLEGSGTVRCLNGLWERLPVCKAPCTIQRTDMFGGVWYETIRDGEELREWCWFPPDFHHTVCHDGVGWYRQCKSTSASSPCSNAPFSPVTCSVCRWSHGLRAVLNRRNCQGHARFSF